jgi:membrane protease YdiL (CAAX protease family)
MLHRFCAYLDKWAITVAGLRRTWFDPHVTWAGAWDICLIFLFLGVVVPWRGRIRLRELLARPEVSSRERMSLYLSTILFQWVAVVICGWRAWAHGFRLTELGIVSPSLPIVAWALLGAATIGALQWFNLRRAGRSGPRGGNLRRLSRAILPHSKGELMVFLGLAFTAGICEEFLYRGFAMLVFLRMDWPTWLVVLASAALFGLAHLYQGRGGLIGTILLGLLFGMLRTVTGSLLSPILCHTAVDIAAGMAGPRFLLQTDSPAKPVSGLHSIT